MYEYDLAIYFWSTIVALGILSPFCMALVREAKNAIEHLHDHGAPPSLVSAPIPSRPSGW